MSRVLIAAVGLALVMTTATVRAQTQHWPNWRGPAASGVSPETGLPVQWSDQSGIAWKVPVRGLGVSSPVVWGNLVFVTSQAGFGESRQGPRLAQGADAAGAGERAIGTGAGRGDGNVTFVITAFDRQTGKQAWQHELKAEGSLYPVHDKHNLASPMVNACTHGSAPAS